MDGTLPSSSSIGGVGPNATSSSILASTAVLAAAALSSLVAVYCYVSVEKMKAKAASPCFQEQGIPMGKGANFLLGHVPLMNAGGNFQVGYQTVFVTPADPASGMCSLWFVDRPTLSVLLARHVKTVLSATSYRQGNSLMDRHNDRFLGSKALSSLNGKDWRTYRSAVHKSFTPSSLKQSQACIHAVGDTLVQSLLRKIHETPACSNEQGSIRHEAAVLPLMKMATIDVFGLAVMDVDFHCCKDLELSPVASAFEFLAEEYTRRLRTPWNPASWLYNIPTVTNRRHLQKRTFIRGFIAEQIAKAQDKIRHEDTSSSSDDNERGDDENARGAALLTNILKVAAAEASKAGDGKDDQISESAILDLVMTLLFGGYDTTSITLSYALYLMATHPEVKQECLKEIDGIVPKSTETSADDNLFLLEDPIRQLPYTHAVVLETLRLFPPAPITLRTLEKPMELEGQVFPVGTNIMVPIWSIQRDERNFPKPLEMHPTRWVTRRRCRREDDDDAAATAAVVGGDVESPWQERPHGDPQDENDGTDGDGDENDGGTTPPGDRDAFCAFAAGARNCVGRKLALQEAVTLLAILLRNLNFALVADGYEVTPNLCSVVQQPMDGLPMIISPRR